MGRGRWREEMGGDTLVQNVLILGACGAEKDKTQEEERVQTAFDEFWS